MKSQGYSAKSRSRLAVGNDARWGHCYCGTLIGTRYSIGPRDLRRRGVLLEPTLKVQIQYIVKNTPYNISSTKNNDLNLSDLLWPLFIGLNDCSKLFSSKQTT